MGFLGNKDPVQVLIATNILVFMIELVNTNWVIENFGLQPASILQSPWTVLTSMFIHADFMHILYNMFALFMFGLYLERIIGEKWFLRVYFIGGLFASLSYLFTSLAFGIPNPAVYAVGASGAIFAVMGALVILRPNMTILFNFFIPMPLYIWAIMYVIIALPSMFSPIGGIAHNAHLGGLVAGILFGYYFRKRTHEVYVHDSYGYRFY